MFLFYTLTLVHMEQNTIVERTRSFQVFVWNFDDDDFKGRMLNVLFDDINLNSPSTDTNRNCNLINS